MKKLLIATILSLSVLTLAACANSDNDENTSENPSQSNQNEESQEVASMTNDDMLEKMKELDYSVIDFDVFYDDTEFEGEVKEQEGVVEAEFYNPFNDIDERGAAAFDAIFPLLEDLDITQDMTDEDAVNTSLEIFELPDDYLKAELSVTFADGTDKTFEVNNNEM